MKLRAPIIIVIIAEPKTYDGFELLWVQQHIVLIIIDSIKKIKSKQKMATLDPQQLANIDSLRSYIDSTSDLGIRQKSDLIKDLNKKKEQMIDSVNNTLSACRDAESVLYNRWINTDNKIAHNKLEEYNRYLKEHHDKGSDIIGQINATKNFEQLNRIEITSVNPFLVAVKSTCDTYARHEALTQTRFVPAPVTLIHPSPQAIRSVSTIQPARTVTTVTQPVTYITNPGSPVPVRVQAPVTHIITQQSVPAPQPVVITRSAPSPRIVTVTPIQAPASPTHHVTVVRTPPPPPQVTVIHTPPPIRTIPIRTVPVRTVRTVPVRTVRTIPVRTVRTVPVKQQRVALVTPTRARSPRVVAVAAVAAPGI